ncbi:hypothetical protein STEG23_037951 [Scotinomys teguina]
MAGESGDESLIIEFWQLVSQDHPVIHASSSDGDQVDDTPTRAIAVHGQSDGCGGLVGGRSRKKTAELQHSFPSLPTTCRVSRKTHRTEASSEMSSKQHLPVSPL